MNWHMRLQYFIMIPLTLTAISLLVIVYRNWWIPTKFTLCILMMMVAGLFAVHVLQRQNKKAKEMVLVATMVMYLVLILSRAIGEIWRWETTFDKQAMMQFSMIIFSLLGACVIVAYYRAKVSYKRVKGNQQHKQWRMSAKKQRKLRNLDGIYLNLGTIYEKQKE